MFEKIFFSSLFAFWLANLGLLYTHQPEQVILFGRIFVAVCIGMANTITRAIGIA